MLVIFHYCYFFFVKLVPVTVNVLSRNGEKSRHFFSVVINFPNARSCGCVMSPPLRKSALAQSDEYLSFRSSVPLKTLAVDDEDADKVSFCLHPFICQASYSLLLIHRRYGRYSTVAPVIPPAVPWCFCLPSAVAQMFSSDNPWSCPLEGIGLFRWDSQYSQRNTISN